MGEAVGRVAEALDAGRRARPLRAPVAPTSARSRRSSSPASSASAARGAEADDGGDVSRCRPAAPVPARRRRGTAGSAARAGRAARPRPWARRTCGAVTEQRSAPSAPKSTATWPAAAQASTCTTTSRARAAATTAAAGCSVPTSWLASCTRHQRGVGPDGRRRPRRDRSDRAGRRRRWSPRSRRAPRRRAPHECSTAVVTTCAAPPRASAPHTAVFTASVPVDGEHDLARPGAEAAPRPARAPSRPRPGWRVPRRAAGRGRRGGRAGRGASPRARPVAAARTTRGRGRRAPRRRPSATRRQTRATQWSSPSGRLVSNCGDVSP